jgi:hypothetical protein
MVRYNVQQAHLVLQIHINAWVCEQQLDYFRVSITGSHHQRCPVVLQ